MSSNTQSSGADDDMDFEEWAEAHPHVTVVKPYEEIGDHSFANFCMIAEDDDEVVRNRLHMFSHYMENEGKALVHLTIARSRLKRRADELEEDIKKAKFAAVKKYTDLGGKVDYVKAQSETDETVVSLQSDLRAVEGLVIEQDAKVSLQANRLRALDSMRDMLKMIVAGQRAERFSQ